MSPAVLAQAIPSAPPEEFGLSSVRLARIRQVLRAEVDEKKLPGAVALVARKGRVAYFDAVGARDPGSGAPLGKDAIFRIHSMTKPFVSVAAMMLAEEGRIVLTDPVSKYLPAFAKMQVSVAKTDSAIGKPGHEMVPAASAPTVYDLLRHTSGLAYAFSTSNAPVKDAYTKRGLARPDAHHAYRDLTAAEEVDAVGGGPRGADLQAAADGGHGVLRPQGAGGAPRAGLRDRPRDGAAEQPDRRARPAEERLGRRRRRLHGVRLPPLLRDAPPRRRAGRSAAPQPLHRDPDDLRSPRQPPRGRPHARRDAPRREGLHLRPGIRRAPRGRPRRGAGTRGRDHLGRRGDVLLDRSAGGAGRHPHDPGRR